MEIWKTFWERKNKINRLKFKYWIIWLMWMQRKTIYSSIILFHYRGQAWLRCDFFLKIRLFQGLMFYNISNAEMYPFPSFYINRGEKCPFHHLICIPFSNPRFNTKKGRSFTGHVYKKYMLKRVKIRYERNSQSLEFVTFVFFMAMPKHINPRLWDHFWN